MHPGLAHWPPYTCTKTHKRYINTRYELDLHFPVIKWKEQVRFFWQTTSRSFWQTINSASPNFHDCLTSPFLMVHARLCPCNLRWSNGVLWVLLLCLLLFCLFLFSLLLMQKIRLSSTRPKYKSHQVYLSSKLWVASFLQEHLCLHGRANEPLSPMC